MCKQQLLRRDTLVPGNHVTGALSCMIVPVCNNEFEKAVNTVCTWSWSPICRSYERRELCNECHTNDNYEINNDIQPGSLVYNWEGQQAAFLKHTIGVQQVCSHQTLGISRCNGSVDCLLMLLMLRTGNRVTRNGSPASVNTVNVSVRLYALQGMDAA